MDILQLVIQLILLPTTIVAVMAYVIRAVFKSYLSMDVERYKSELQTDLEGYKAKLNAQYDALQFEFQQRFSSMYSKESDAIVNLYSMLAEIYIPYELIMVFLRGGTTPGTRAFGIDENVGPDKQPIGCYVAAAKQKCEEFDNYFRKKKIFFDDDICSKSQKVVDTVASLAFEVQQVLEFRTRNLDLKPVWLSKADADFRKLQELESALKSQFRLLLSVSPPKFVEDQSGESNVSRMG